MDSNITSSFNISYKPNQFDEIEFLFDPDSKQIREEYHQLFQDYLIKNKTSIEKSFVNQKKRVVALAMIENDAQETPQYDLINAVGLSNFLFKNTFLLKPNHSITKVHYFVIDQLTKETAFTSYLCEEDVATNTFNKRVFYHELLWISENNNNDLLRNFLINAALAQNEEEWERGVLTFHSNGGNLNDFSISEKMDDFLALNRMLVRIDMVLAKKLEKSSKSMQTIREDDNSIFFDLIEFTLKLLNQIPLKNSKDLIEYLKNHNDPTAKLFLSKINQSYQDNFIETIFNTFENLRQEITTNLKKAEHSFSNQIKIDSKYLYTKHSEDSIEILKQGVLFGDSFAKFQLSLAYLEGQEVTKNTEKGFKYLTEAADEGVAEAQFNLGLRLGFKLDCDGDKDLSLKYLHLAIQNNHGPDAQFLLSKIISDPNESVGLLLDAAKKGHLLAKVDLYEMYLNVNFLREKKNEEKLLNQLKIHAQNGIIEAMYLYAELLTSLDLNEEALNLYKEIFLIQDHSRLVRIRLTNKINTLKKQENKDEKTDILPSVYEKEDQNQNKKRIKLLFEVASISLLGLGLAWKKRKPLKLILKTPINQGFGKMKKGWVKINQLIRRFV